jgi:hypothetical protein
MEQKISEETEALAKSKGCNLEHCRCGGFPDCICSDTRITQSELQKWLRDAHKIHIAIERTSDMANETYNEADFQWLVSRELFSQDVFDREFYQTYEAALEIALVAALNVI